MSESNVPQMMAELSKLGSTEDALAALELLEKNRREQYFIKYWAPITEGQKEVLRGFVPGIKTFVVTGGNRSGKTEIGSAIAVAWALGKDFFRGEPAWEWVESLPIPDPPNNIWVVGLDFPTIRDVIWHEKLRFGKDHPPFFPKDPKILEARDGDFRALFKNNSILTCKSADSGREKFQGASVDLVWIDEEPDVDIYDECFQRTVDCGGKLFVTLTPLTDIGSGTRVPWVFGLHEQMRAGQKDIAFGKLSVLDNPKVPPEEKERLRQKWAGHHEEGARLFGEFIQRQGLVYSLWNPAKHIVAPFRIPNEWRKIVSIDPASTGVTAAVWGAVSPEGDLYLYREYYERNLVISEHAKNILVRNAGDIIDFWLLDPKFGAQKNAETHRTNLSLYRDAGIPARLADVEEDFGVNASLEYVNATVTADSRWPKLFVFPGMKNFIWEIGRYTWDQFHKGPQKGLTKERPRKRDDHLMNAFQYLCAIRPRPRRLGGPQRGEDKISAAQRNSYT